jgi:hypothetical protein
VLGWTSFLWLSADRTGALQSKTHLRTDLSQNFEIPDEMGTIDTNVIHLISYMFYVEQCPVLTQIKP